MSQGSLASDEIVLPFIPSVGRYRFSTVIEDTQYVFDVRWNTRDAAWYFDVREADLTIIASGLKIVLGTYIGRQSTHSLFSDGVFVAYDQSRQGLDAGLDDLGARVQVKYLTRLELARRQRQSAIFNNIDLPLSDEV